MSDNGEDEEEEEPVVELGDGPDVEGAPVSRVASRLFFPIEKSEVLRREGETTVRTPDGPQAVEDVLAGSDEVYFETNADLVSAVRSAVGTGPVPTAGGASGAGGAGDTDAAGDDADADDGPAEDDGFEFADADAASDGEGSGDEESDDGVEGDGGDSDGDGGDSDGDDEEQA